MANTDNSQYGDEPQAAGVSGRMAAQVLLATMTVMVVLYGLINWLSG